MANSAEIMEYILTDPPHSTKPITYQWLLPNLKGLQNLFAVQDSIGTQAKNVFPTPPASPASPPYDAASAMNTSNQDPNEMLSRKSGMNAISKSSRDDVVGFPDLTRPRTLKLR